MQAIVIHSGGMDSSICLAAAIAKWGCDQVLSLSFRYGQRHEAEIERAALICSQWQVRHVVVPITALGVITDSALLGVGRDIVHPEGQAANTEVVGRNGLMARLGAIYGHQIGVLNVYMGVLGLEEECSGYRDCSRAYMDLMEKILRIDLDDERFAIITPLVHLTKEESLDLALSLGQLEFLLETTITCYRGRDKMGCETCPACLLRNTSLRIFANKHPELQFSYRRQLLSTL